MDTSVGYYQAPRPPRVPLDEVLIKLYPEGYHEEFQADGINVGPGGISMRSSVLPEVGATMRCEFESPSGCAPIQMTGRVVWAHQSGPYVGEFGIRFTELSDVDQSRIEALIQRWRRASTVAPTVRLQLEGVESPIVAEVKSETDEALSVEQPLPFLSIGTQVRNECVGRLGHLEGVDLKLDDKTPRLVLSIGYVLDSPGVTQQPRIVTREPERARALPRPIEPIPDPDDLDTLRDEDDLALPRDDLRQHLEAAAALLKRYAGSVRTTTNDTILPRVSTTAKRTLVVGRRFATALRGRLGERPRRKQVPQSRAARDHLKNTKRSHWRSLWVALAVALLAVAGGFGYDLLAGTEAEEPPSTPANTTEEIVAEDFVQGQDSAAAEVGPEAPKEATLTDAQGPTAEPVEGSSFGAEQVPRAETYVLRMSNPVERMEGVREQDGFSVTIPGSLSLSRAGPIAAAHPDVERAVILNRGEFSELTIRFVAGRRPAYRVDAKGPTLRIQIAR